MPPARGVQRGAQRPSAEKYDPPPHLNNGVTTRLAEWSSEDGQSPSSGWWVGVPPVARKKKGRDKMQKAKSAAVFSKLQLVKSLRFKKHADLLNTALENGKNYSIEQVKEIIEKFMKGRVI